jgi:hypothetical protein
MSVHDLSGALLDGSPKSAALRSSLSPRFREQVGRGRLVVDAG